MKAILNFPVDVNLIHALVEDDQDLRLMMPSAEIPFDEKQWEEILSPTSNSLSFIVKKENETIGHFALLRIDKEIKEATLGLIYLTNKLRKTGTAHDLLKLAEQTAKNLFEIKTLKLNVRSFNLSAYNLYLKSGYTEYENIETLIRMQKSLS